MMSLALPVILTYPSRSREPRSPVRNQPSGVKADAVASGSPWYPWKTEGPLSRISPSAEMRTDMGGSGGPTVPIFVSRGMFTEIGPTVSVRP